MTRRAERALALAWALKDRCYAAWSTDPPRAVRAAAALRRLARRAPGPVVQALADWTGGLAAVIGGRMAEAVAGFDRAAAGLQAAGLPDPAAQSQVPKIMALSMLGRHAEAVACAEACQRALLALGNVAAAARVSQNLGSLQLRRDAYAAAAGHYREAAVLSARLGDHPASVLADIGQADALAALGDFDEALRIYDRARMRAERRGLGLPLALVDESRALVELARGRYAEALAGLDRACRGYAALALPSYQAVAEKQLGDTYLELRLLPEAHALLDQAVARFAVLDLPDEQAAALAQRGRAEALRGDPAADRSFEAAAALFERQGNPVGQARVALARAERALARGDSAAAEALAAAALEGFARSGRADGRLDAELLRAQARLAAGALPAARADFQRLLRRAGARRQRAAQVRCHTGLGGVRQAEGDAAGARRHFERAIALLEAQRRVLPGDEIRSAFLTDHARPYLERLRQALEGGDGAEVLRQLERYRARTLDERVQGGAADPLDDDEASQALRTRLDWLARRAVRQDEPLSPALADERARLEAELLERARRQRLARPGQDPGPGNGTAFDPTALRAALAPGQGLLAWGIAGDEVFACLLRPEGVRLRRHLARAADLAAAQQALAFQLDALRHGLAPVRAHLPQLAARARARLAALHTLLWAPLEADLQGLQALLLVPPGELAGLPFAALAPEGGEPLAARYALAQAPSARLALHGLRRPPRAPARVLALGESSRLPQAGAEAQAVAACYPEGRLAVGAEATRAALAAGAGAADVLHLACHAQFRGDSPRFSALHLADGPLTADAVERLQLPPATVVLSACETGLADQAPGDEMVGLVRAFLVAGAARVVASLWPVEDGLARTFMEDFHAGLAGGAAPAVALGRAQAALRTQVDHPHAWAAFTLHGGW